MPPKGRKSVSPWLKCDACHVTLSQRDQPTHVESSCPPPKETWTHGYIKNNILYGMLEELKSKETLKSVPKEECSKLVLLSQSAMQLCGICIGDPVVLSYQGTVCVKTAWPTLEKTLTSILLTKEGLETFCVPCPGRAELHKLDEEPLPAGEVHVLPSDVPHVVLTMLHASYRGSVICERSKLRIPFYGRSLICRVKCISPWKTDCVDELMERLQVGENAVKYFKIVEGTKWLLYGEQTEKEEVKNGPCLSRIGGLSEVSHELQELIRLALRNTPLFTGLKLIRGILVYGVSGTGKTLLINALAEDSGATVLNIHGAEVYSKYFGETEARLKAVFQEAKDKAPSIIVLDEIDCLCPRRSSSSSEQEKRVVAMLVTLLDSLHADESCAVLVLATTSKPDALDSSLRRPGRIDREVEISVPNPKERTDILHKLLAGTSHKLDGESIRDVALAAHGFVGADLASLCSQAGMHASKRGADSISISDLSWALTQVKPSAMREVLVQVPNVKWSDIGGQHDLKLKLQQAVEWPLKHPEVFTRLAISPPKGVLMFGPPGCSKTMIAKALATESGLNFLSIKGPELFSKWVGESERAVREVFRRARQVAPSVVFFDELDALGGERSGSQSGSNVEERVLAQLLTELDGVEPLGNVTVLAATNRPDRIDKALLRPGRLDRIVYVPLPDEATRFEIFSLKLSKMPITADVQMEELVQWTEGYSGAEVLAVCHEAALKALEENLEAQHVSRNHFLAAVALVPPRTPSSLLQLYDEYHKR